MGESDLDQLIAPVYTKVHQSGDHDSGRPGRYSGPSARARRNRGGGRALLAEVAPADRRAAGRSHLFAQRRFARSRGRRACCVIEHATLSVAESCTGGMLGAAHHLSRRAVRIISWAGFSSIANRMKTDLLGVDRGADRAPHRGERRGRLRDGRRRAREDRIDLCDLDHRRSGTAKARRARPWARCSSASRLRRASMRAGSPPPATASASGRFRRNSRSTFCVAG